MFVEDASVTLAKPSWQVKMKPEKLSIVGHYYIKFVQIIIINLYQCNDLVHAAMFLGIGNGIRMFLEYR